MDQPLSPKGEALRSRFDAAFTSLKNALEVEKKPVFNRIVTLKDTWAKEAGKGG